MTFLDHLNRNINLDYQPQRIVCLVPSLTELLHDLGLEKRIVGITQFCAHPYHYQSVKTIVGGTKKVDLYVLKSLNPDFILCSKEENTLEMVEELEKIAPVFVSDINDFQGALKLILELGEIFGKRIESENMVNKIEIKHNEFQHFIQEKRQIKTAYFIWKNPWMVAGNNTFINEMLRINHLENIFVNKERYPEINIQYLKLQGNPELLLFSSEPYHFKEEDAFEVLRENEKMLTIFVDGQYFSWYGSRLLKAFDYFKQLQEKIISYS